MSIGALGLRVVLDEPNKIHYGSSDPVTGNIAVTFQAGSKHIAETGGGELFGPLRITITLHGRCKTKIWRRQGQHTSIYRGRVDLFSIQKTILEAQFRSQPSQTQLFPFEISFPSKPAPGFDAGWEADKKYQVEEWLPPSFMHYSRGLGHHFESFIEYRLGVAGLMPNIRVDMHAAGKYDETIIRYERQRLLPPASGRMIEGRGMVKVSNENLLPPEQRPSGFRQKMMATFTSNNFPTYLFTWRFVGPQFIHLLEPITFNVSIKPMIDQYSPTQIPDVFLSGFIFEIKGNTFVRAERQLFSCPEADAETTLVNLSGGIPDKGPFSKANDWSKSVIIGRLTDFPTQFSTPNISRRYTMKIKIYFRLAGVEKDFTQRFQIGILPPMQSTDPGIGSSRAQASSAREDADDMILPVYEPPPNYEEEIEE